MSNQTTGQTSDQKNSIAVMPDVHVLASVTSFQEITDRIRGLTSDVLNNFVQIGAELKKLRDDPKILTDCGYSDVYAYAQKVFGFQSTSAKNFIAVYEKFGDKDGSRPEISRKYEKFSISQLIELVPVSGDIDKFAPEMTVKEIRDKKALDAALKEKEDLEKYAKRCLSAVANRVMQNVSGPQKPKSYRFGYDKIIAERFEGTVLVDAGKDKCKERKASIELGFNTDTLNFVLGDIQISGRSPYVVETMPYDGVPGFPRFESEAAKIFEAKVKAVSDEEKIQKDDKAKFSEEGDHESAKDSRKPEWLRWDDMTPAKKSESLTKDRIACLDCRDDFHQFFAGSYDKGDEDLLLGFYGAEENDDFFPGGFEIIVSYARDKEANPLNAERDDEKPLDVMYVVRDPISGKMRSLTPSEALAYIQAEVTAKRKAFEAKKAEK